ncbi:MAG: hypothetical protein NTX29_17515, partial [Actinobacteria bacterium]|nr:hypothetical protein [Actinomycetota bacterium]
MDSLLVYVVIAVLVLVIATVGIVALRRGKSPSGALDAKPRPGIDYAPGVGDDDSVPRDTPRRTVDVIEVGEPLAGPVDEPVLAEPMETAVEDVSLEDLEGLLLVEVPEPA